MQRARLTLQTLTCLAVLATGCAREPIPGETWEELRDRFLEAYSEANPGFAVFQGRHEFDGRLPDWSREGIERHVAELRRFRDQAAAFDDPETWLEREHLLAVIDERLFWLTEAEAPFRNPVFYSDRLDPSLYLIREYAPLERRLAAYVAWLGELPRVTRQVRENLRPPLPRTFAAVGRQTAAGLATYVENDVPPVFASLDDETLAASGLEEATVAARDALMGLAAFYAGLETIADDGFALGPELYRRMLWTGERVDVPLDVLAAAAERELERNLAALADACAALLPGAGLDRCVAHVQAQKPKGGPVAAARRQLDELERFVVDQELVTIPGTERLEVREAPPHQRWDAAYIDIPGPDEDGLPSVYYISPPDPAWSAEEQREYVTCEAELLFTSVHEGWPGHFLQGLFQNRAASPIARYFYSYASSEGWALYAEEMTWDAGLRQGDPAAHVGQLTNALLRDVRMISSIGLHTGGMTVEESERLFREKAFQNPAYARQQAARGTFDPGYLYYTLGKLMILELRDDWTREHAGKDTGGRNARHLFHDRLLALGAPPLPLARRALLGSADGLLDEP